nr:hypothetical protein [Bacillus licheniformis]
MISGEDEYVFRTAVHIFNAERLFLAFHCIIQEKGFCCFIIADGHAVLALFAAVGDASDRALWRIVLFGAVPVSAIAAKLIQDRRKTES